MPVQNYIKLFRENRRLLESGSSAVLNGRRDVALENLEKHGLPLNSMEEYLHSNVSEWFEPDWGINLGRIDIPTSSAAAFRCNVPNLNARSYFMLNDIFEAERSPDRTTLQEGIIAGSLREISLERPDIIERYYDTISDTNKAGAAAINTLFAQDGFVLYISDNVTVEKPIQLVSLLSSPVDLMVNRRVLIIVGTNVRVKLLLCDHAISPAAFLTTQVVELFAGQGSNIELYDLEETHAAGFRFNELYLKQDSYTDVAINLITLHNGKTRNSVYATLEGGGASLSLNGVAITDKSQHVDNFTFVDHRVPNCTSSELFNYVLDQQSVGVFAGKVLVRPGAQHTVSQQKNRNICLTRQSRVFTQPQLEIYADDVKCSHGATVGRLDENALFYIRQRGIPEQEARMLLLIAFVNEVIDLVELEPFRNRLKRLVEKRFRGELSQCEGCRICR
ncbi:MAG TPA: Fe-S cluster assembly protein SufD [Bacteroidaceae bacterium]|mgnify:FL=1|nr:Fe-S cluster assembly protein SufD [Bacteroidaceae bacterium]